MSNEAPTPRVHRRLYLWLGVVWMVFGIVSLFIDSNRRWLSGFWILFGLTWLWLWAHGEKPSRRRSP